MGRKLSIWGDKNKFAVTPEGKLFATDVAISGGDIDVGGAATVYTNGSGSSGATSITVTSSAGITSGRLVFGSGIASGTVVTSVVGTTIGLNKATTGSVFGSIRFVASSGVHITSSGDLYAIGGNFNGNITATSGTIEGNLQVISGTFYTGTSPTSTSVLINDKGLASIDASNVTLTAMLNTPISSGNIPLGNGQTNVGTLPNAISFFTQAALIGGWVVNSTTLKDRSSQFVLDSENKYVQITGTDELTSSNFRVELGTGANVFSAGTVGQTPSTSISRSGVLTANNADIRGTLTTSSGNMKFGDKVNGNTNHGIYIDPDDFWYSTGSFSLGGGALVYDAGTQIFELNKAGLPFAKFKFKLNVSSNGDGTAGDPTVVQDSNGYITLGRAFFYAGNNYPDGALSRADIPSQPGKEQGTAAFSVGDVVLSRKP